MTRPPLRALRGLGVVALVAAGLVLLFGATAFSRSVKRSTSVEGGVRTVVVTTERGDVDVVASASGRVRVSQRATSLFRPPAARVESIGGELRVQGTCEQVWIGSCHTSFRIEVPAAVTVVVRTRQGDVDLQGMHGRVDIATRAGDISGRGLGGADVQAVSTAGDVSLALDTRPTRVEATTSAGDVDLRVPRGSYRVNAVTSAGSRDVSGVTERVDATASIRAWTGAGDVQVRTG